MNSEGFMKDLLNIKVDDVEIEEMHHSVEYIYNNKRMIVMISSSDNDYNLQFSGGGSLMHSAKTFIQTYEALLTVAKEVEKAAIKNGYNA